jgi:hypothetical protein
MSRRAAQPSPITGHLAGISVPELLRDLGRSGATGCLHLRRHAVTRVLQVKAGRVVFASSSDPNDRLGEQMLRAGKISLGQLETALAAQSSGKRLGTLMVEAHITTREELVASVREQLRSIVLDTMSWTEAEYRFDPAPELPEEDIELGLTLEQLLFEGVRGTQALKFIDRSVGPRTTVRLAPEWTDRVALLELTEAAQALLERLAAGPGSCDVLCRDVCGSNFEIQRTLWALCLIGAVEPVDRPGGADGRDGSLSETSLPELLIRFERELATGVLYLVRGTQERRVLFATGRCVFATSNDPDDGLVQFLYRRGIISLRDREETVRRILSNKRVGTILRELGVIDDDDLQHMVRQQVSEIIYDTVGWEQGAFLFVPGSLPSAEEITLNTSAGALVAEGVRRISSWTRLVRGCGGVDNPLCLTPSYLNVLDCMEASVAEWEVINALKSPQTPRRVCAMVAMNDLRTCQILWTLKLLGAVADSPVDLEDGTAMDATFAREPGDEAAPATAEAREPRVAIDAANAPASVAACELVEEDAGPEPWTGSPRGGDDGDRVLDHDRLPSLELALEHAEAEADDTHAQEQDAGYEPKRALEPEVSQAVAETIERFNAIHRVVFRAVRAEIGAGAVNFVRSCCGQLDPDPLDGVPLLADGSWDVGGLKQGVVERGLGDPWPEYQRVLDQEFVSLEPHLGEARAVALKQRIWEIAQAS